MCEKFAEVLLIDIIRNEEVLRTNLHCEMARISYSYLTISWNSFEVQVLDRNIERAVRFTIDTYWSCEFCSV